MRSAQLFTHWAGIHPPSGAVIWADPSSRRDCRPVTIISRKMASQQGRLWASYREITMDLLRLEYAQVGASLTAGFLLSPSKRIDTFRHDNHRNGHHGSC